MESIASSHSPFELMTDQSETRAFARAPMRISFAGGGTDVAPYPEREGGAVLSAAIRRYAYASARIRADDQFVIRSLDLGLVSEGRIGELSELDQRLHLLSGPVSRLASDGHELSCAFSRRRRQGLGSALRRQLSLPLLALCWQPTDAVARRIKSPEQRSRLNAAISA